MLLEAKRAGDALLAAKAKVKHGEFKAWVEGHCRCSYETANRYCRVARIASSKNVTLDTFEGGLVAFLEAHAKPRVAPPATTLTLSVEEAERALKINDRVERGEGAEKLVARAKLVALAEAHGTDSAGLVERSKALCPDREKSAYAVETEAEVAVMEAVTVRYASQLHKAPKRTTSTGYSPCPPSLHPSGSSSACSSSGEPSRIVRRVRTAITGATRATGRRVLGGGAECWLKKCEAPSTNSRGLVSPSGAPRAVSHARPDMTSRARYHTENARVGTVRATIPSTFVLAISEIDGETRVLDVALGEALGMTRPTNIRPTIAAHREALEAFGSLHAARAVIEAGKGAQREVAAYWLNEEQAFYIALHTKTERAQAVKVEPS